MKRKTKGQIEAEVSEAITNFHKQCVGKGPDEVRSHIVEDIIIIRLKGILTTGEKQLIKIPEGLELVKRCRTCAIERARQPLREILGGLSNVKIVTLYVDVKPEIEEMFVVISLSENIEARLQRKKKIA